MPESSCFRFLNALAASGRTSQIDPPCGILGLNLYQVAGHRGRQFPLLCGHALPLAKPSSATRRGRDPIDHQGVSRGRFKNACFDLVRISKALNVRRLTSKMVVEWLCRFKEIARPYVARGAKTLAITSTGASMNPPRRRVPTPCRCLEKATSTRNLHAIRAHNARSGVSRSPAANTRSMKLCACRRVSSLCDGLQDSHFRCVARSNNGQVTDKIREAQSGLLQ